jgi:hypothetical protein
LKSAANYYVVTKDVEPFTFRCKTSGISYCIIDTPGFNDTYLTDNDVLKAIASWLEKDAVRMNGIIYLHRISDPRMEGSALRNLRMFRQLCGEDFMKNVILATTFWDTVSEATGVAREKELLETDGFFKEMKDQGCDIVRISRDYDESLRLLSRFIEKRPTVMKIQQELLDGKSLASTAAASAINEELAELQRQNSVKMADAAHQARGIVLKSELNLALTRKLNQRAFEETLDEAREKHEEVAREMEEMEEKTAQRLETLNQEKNHQEQAFKVELGALSEQLKKLNSARIG